MASLKDYGIMLEPQQGMRMKEIIELASYAEKAGFGYVFRSDHLLPTSGTAVVESPECWVSLGALAASTKSIRFGPMVSPVGFRNPTLLAKMAFTLYSFSDKRFVLGLGAGWFKREYEAYGMEFPDTTTRISQLRETLVIIRELVSKGATNFDAVYFKSHTKMLQRPMDEFRVIVGGRDSRIARLAATLGDELNLFSPSIEMIKRSKMIIEAESKSRKVELSRMGPFIVGENRAELLRRVKRFAGARGISADPASFVKILVNRGFVVGTTKEFLDCIGRMKEAGLGRIYFQLFDPKDMTLLDALVDTLKGS